MRKSKRKSVKNRSEKGRFLQMPHALLTHQNYLSLSAHARALLIDIALQYNGYNNGDLCAAWTFMKKRGHKSKDTLNRKLNELLEKGMIIKSRQGCLGKCNLFAITWQPINECKGKLDIKPSSVAPGNWKIIQTDDRTK